MKVFEKLKESSIYLALLAIVIFFSVTTTTFLSATNFINIVNQIAVLGILSVGMTFVVLSGGVDLSVGSQISICGIIMGILMVKFNLHPILAVIIGILICTAIGLINGLIVTITGITPIIATLGMLQIIKGLSYTICNGMPIFGFTEKFSIIGQGYVWIIPISTIIFLAIILIVSFVLNKVYFGRYFYAVGGNAEATRLSGINTNKVKLIAYMVCGFFTGIAGTIVLSRINSALPLSGIGMEMDVLTAVILGGVSMNGGEGKISGVIAGVLIIGVLGNGLVMLGAREYVQIMVKGAVLLLALGLDQLKKISFKAPRLAA